MRYLDVIGTARRYARSINLERDLFDPTALGGYVVTPRVKDTLELFRDRFEKSIAVRAFTVTAVYGAGKSAFMHFLLSLLAPKKTALSAAALKILKAQKISAHTIRFFEELATLKTGFLRIVAVSRNESIGMTLARAIHNATLKEYGQAEKYAHLCALEYIRQNQKGKAGQTARLIEAINVLAGARPVIIAIDELGKNLEQAALGENDVYLLQLLAELPLQKHPVFFFGLLHSAFSDYGGRLGAQERSEWQKIQGRFEDIPFLDSTENTMALIATAIEQQPAAAAIAAQVGKAWQGKLPGNNDLWAKVFPLHPLSARALPLLCARFGQNERSLFNFLTGHEPHSFHAFLSHTEMAGKEPRLLRLSHLYDYFIESASLASIERQSRLIELRDRIRANEHLDLMYVEVLKTIAVLNALSTGDTKASREMVMFAMADSPGFNESVKGKILAELIAKRIITYRKQANEYRLWAGSENDVEALIKEEINHVPKNLAHALNAKFTLRTVVASRHSFETGTLRYFQALFVDNGQIALEVPQGDGYVLYDISDHSTENISNANMPQLTPPTIRITSSKNNALRKLAQEVLALESLMHGRQALSLDAVARREITERYHLMADRLRDVIQNEFTNISSGAHIESKPALESYTGTLNQLASALCDIVYSSGFRLNNELINRQSISAQIARARGDIVARLLKYRDHAADYFEGNGPEVSIFRVLTEKQYQTGLKPAREAIKKFGDKAKEARPLIELFNQLSQPPYGIRQGIIPLLLVQYLLDNEESVTLYQDGSFIPEITPEILEILVRRPEKFSLKKFAISGIETRYLEELTKMYGNGTSQGLLAIVKPLVRFNRSLPRYTQQTRTVSENAQRLRTALAYAKEPDTLIFKEIPQALSANLGDNQGNATKVRVLVKNLTQALHELQNAYGRLLDSCQKSLIEALRIPQYDLTVTPIEPNNSTQSVPGIAQLRHYVSAIAGLLTGSVIDPLLKRFLLAATDKNKPDQIWLESIIMVVADKPADVWRDEDKDIFEVNLSALAQKFLNLHHLAAKVQAAGQGNFTAKLVTITTAEGKETREVVYTSRGEEKQINLLRETLGSLPQWQAVPDRVKQAMLADILQQLLENESPGAEIKPKNAVAHEPADAIIRIKTGGKKHG